MSESARQLVVLSDIWITPEGRCAKFCKHLAWNFWETVPRCTLYSAKGQRLHYDGDTPARSLFCERAEKNADNHGARS